MIFHRLFARSQWRHDPSAGRLQSADSSLEVSPCSSPNASFSLRCTMYLMFPCFRLMSDIYVAPFGLNKHGAFAIVRRWREGVIVYLHCRTRRRCSSHSQNREDFVVPSRQPKLAEGMSATVRWSSSHLSALSYAPLLTTECSSAVGLGEHTACFSCLLPVAETELGVPSIPVTSIEL